MLTPHKDFIVMQIDNAHNFKNRISNLIASARAAISKQQAKFINVAAMYLYRACDLQIKVPICLNTDASRAAASVIYQLKLTKPYSKIHVALASVHTF
jgi:hypothetical protein